MRVFCQADRRFWQKSAYSFYIFQNLVEMGSIYNGGQQKLLAKKCCLVFASFVNQATHFPRIEVIDSFDEFFFGIHDKGAVAGNWFIDWFTV